MPRGNIPDFYAHALRSQGFGHALYRPVGVSELRCGSVGFLNDKGRWCSLVRNLGDAEYPLAPFTDHLQPKTSIALHHHLICSENIKKIEIDTKASLDASFAGVPAGLEATLGFHSESKGGAILVCDPITSDTLDHDHAPLIDWGKLNAEKIFKRKEVTKERGFFIVTAVHRTERCHMKCWLSRSRRWTSKGGVNTSPAGSANVDTSVTTSRAATSWVSWGPDGEKYPLDNEVVVFLEGYQFVPRLWGWRAKVERRGDESEDSDSDDDPRAIDRRSSSDSDTAVNSDGNELLDAPKNCGALELPGLAGQKYALFCQDWVSNVGDVALEGSDVR